jgi:hypothetical protein
MIGSDLGQLQDLSATGARVACSTRAAPQPGEALWFSIEGVDGDFQVCARVVWIRRLGSSGRELGLEFIEPDAKVGAALVALARTAASNQTLGLDRVDRASA